MYFGKKRTKEERDQSPVNKVETESSLDSFLDKSSLDVVYPFSWEEFPDYIESGDNFIRVIAIVDYPKVQYGNWL